MRVWPVDGDIVTGGTVRIKGADARHIVKVLRLGAGDGLKISDSNSRIFEARIREVKNNSVNAEIIRQVKSVKIGRPDVFLSVSICKPSVMELMVQKAVELGCNYFQPVVTERSFNKAISEAKILRLQKIAHEAMKQCGRASPMVIYKPVSLKEIPDAKLKIVLYEEEKKKSLGSVLAGKGKPETVSLLIGPPGGFTAEEVAGLKQGGYKSAGMGGLILKSETAAISLLSVVNHHFSRIG